MRKISVLVTHNLIKEISPSDSRFLSFGPDMKGREKFRVDIVNIRAWSHSGEEEFISEREGAESPVRCHSK